MSEIESQDFFRDDELVADPYPYFDCLREQVPGAARAAPRRRDGDGLRRGDRGLQRHRRRSRRATR